MKRGSGIGWPIGVAVILALTVAANIGVIMIARDDPSFAVEPDYYRKAVEWDATMAQERANASLGWRFVPTLSPVTAQGPATLVVRLHDAAGAPVSGASVRVEALHNARASQVLAATLAPTPVAGAYEGSLPLHRAGQWELRLEATRGEVRFTQRLRVEALLASREAARDGAPAAGGARGAGM